MLRLRLSTLAGLFALGACSSDIDLAIEADEDTEEVEVQSASPADEAAPPVDGVLPELVSLEEQEEDFQRRARTALDDNERLKVERVLDAFGVSPDEAAIVGRLVLHDHVYTEAEELIALPEEAVAKGRVISRIFTTTTATPGPTPQQQLLPELFARMNGGNFQFFRPYVQRFSQIITANDDIILSLFQLVAQNVNNAATDCLASGASGTLRAVSAATFNAQSATERSRIPVIAVIRGSLDTACPGAAALSPNVKGCSLGFRHRNILHPDGVTRSTMVFGPRIGVLDTAVTGLNGLSRRIATHELLHTLGMAHPSQSLADGNGDGQPDAIVVPGTSSATNVISVLQNECAPGTNCSVANPPICCGSVSNDMSLDDIAVIDRLYSPQPGGSCNYVNAFQNIVGP